MRRTVICLFVLLTSALAGWPVGAQAASPPLPSSMAAIGDSITRGFDVCCWYGDHRGQSWSTGGLAFDGVHSQYERLRALHPDIGGHHHNDARSGARMAAAPRQAQAAVAQEAEYVTVLMGANDLCTSSPSTMTSVVTFRDQFRQTLDILFSGLADDALVSVSSIPDLHQLWQLLHASRTARFVWSTAGICPSLLSPLRTPAGRQRVRDRNVAFNTVLREECATYVRCRFDDNALFSHPFTGRNVSKLDYFHPSLSGQAALARLSWAASWWG